MKPFWNNLRPFEKAVFVGVTALVLIVFNTWLVVPHFSDWSQMKNRKRAAEKKLETYKMEIAKINQYDLEAKQLEGKDLFVPPEEQRVQFIRAIYSQARQSQVRIMAVSK